MGKTRKIITIIACLIIGAGISFLGARELMQTRQLAARGKSTTGRVIDSEERIGGRYNRHTYYLEIIFQPESGGERDQKIKVSRQVYEFAQGGNPVKVWYLAEDPGICAAGDKVEVRYGNLVFGLGMIGVAIFLMFTFKTPDTAAEVAENIDAKFKTLTVTRYEYGPANADDFKHLDLAFYNAGQQHLESLGYKFMADEENLTIRKSNGTRALLRYMVSADRTTLATLYHFKKFPLKEAKVLDLETWFANGQIISTSNATAAGKFDYPPQIDAFFFSTPAPLEAVVQAHQPRINNYLTQNPGVQAIALNSLEDIRRSGDELQRIKSEFRSRKGLSREELGRIAGRNIPQLDEIHDALAERQGKPRSDDASK